MAGPTRLFLIFPLFGCVNQVGVSMLVGLGRAKPVLLLQLIAVGLNLVLSIALVGPLGISGVILGTLIGNAVIWLPYLALTLSTFEIEVVDWLRRIVLPNLPGALVQVTLGLLTLHWVSMLDQLWQVLLVCAGSCATSLVVFATVGLGGEERRHLITRTRTG